MTHDIDPHSRINVPNPNNLRSLTYTTIDPAGTSTAPPGSPRRAQQRFFAHGHAACIRYNRIRDFTQQDPNSANQVDFPVYNQIGSYHLYILSEDESADHPRQHYLNDDNGARPHDEL